MHVATTDAPYSRARCRRRSSRVPSASPSSRLTELRMALPPIHWSPVSITFGSVESSMIGRPRLGGEPGGDGLHVGHAVLAGVVDADVEDVGALLHLVLGHVDAGVPVVGQH